MAASERSVPDLEKFLKNFLRECQLNGIFVMILQMSLMKPALLYKNVNVT